MVRAYRDLGLRALIGLGMSDRAYHETVVLDAGLVSAELIDRLERDRPPAWDEWESFTRHAVERFHRPDEGISICPAPSGPQRCTDEMLAGCAALADELDLMIHIHVLETRMQAVSGPAACTGARCPSTSTRSASSRRACASSTASG